MTKAGASAISELGSERPDRIVRTKETQRIQDLLYTFVGPRRQKVQSRMKLPARIVNENSVSEVPGKKALPVTGSTYGTGLDDLSQDNALAQAAWRDPVRDRSAAGRQFHVIWSKEKCGMVP